MEDEDTPLHEAVRFGAIDEVPAFSFFIFTNDKKFSEAPADIEENW